MNILIMTIPISILLASLFLMLFISAVSKDQYEDLETPAHTILADDNELIDNELTNKTKKEEETEGIKKHV